MLDPSVPFNGSHDKEQAAGAGAVKGTSDRASSVHKESIMERRVESLFLPDGSVNP